MSVYYTVCGAENRYENYTLREFEAELGRRLDDRQLGILEE